MKRHDTIESILDTLAEQARQGETSLIVRVEPSLIPEAMNSLKDYRKLFVPIIPGLTDTAPIYAAYERMRQDCAGRHCILLLVECQTEHEFRQALDPLPLRHSSEWRDLPDCMTDLL